MSIDEKVADLMDFGFDVGTALGSVIPLDGGGSMQTFEGAAIYQNPAGESFEVHGAILGQYIEEGETASALGYPASDESDNGNEESGRQNFFDGGVILWNPAEGVRVQLYEEGGEGEEEEEVETQEVLNAEIEAKGAEIAGQAYALLTLPLAESKKTIFEAEHPADPNNWCGNTLAHFYKAVGADSKITAAYFAGTAGLLSYGSYYRVGYDPNTGALVQREHPARKTRIVVEGVEWDLEAYHAERGALRKIILFDEIGSETPLDILPGDIVLFDGRNKGGPDHIQVAYDWNEEDRVLVVIDGNGGGFALAQSGVQGVALAAHDVSHDGVGKLDKQSLLTDKMGEEVVYTNDGATGRVGVTCHVLTAAHQVAPPADNPSGAHARVWAVIRPSMVDFETHTYKNM